MRLIDADALNKRVRNEGEKDAPILWGAYTNVVFLIEDAPTIEAEPVRRGKWEYAEDEVLDDLTFSAWKCSRCGYYTYQPEFWHYCPKCGAKMDGEVDHDE